MAELGLAQPNALEYAGPSRARAHSAWSLVGFALALLLAVPAAMMWWDLWSMRGSGATQIGFGVSPVYYVIAAAVAALCVIGMRRGAKLFGTLGLIILAVAVGAMVLIVAGSPW